MCPQNFLRKTFSEQGCYPRGTFFHARSIPSYYLVRALYYNRPTRRRPLNCLNPVLCWRRR